MAVLLATGEPQATAMAPALVPAPPAAECCTRWCILDSACGAPPGTRVAYMDISESPAHTALFRLIGHYFDSVCGLRTRRIPCGFRPVHPHGSFAEVQHFPTDQVWSFNGRGIERAISVGLKAMHRIIMGIRRGRPQVELPIQD
jgi:hypothetical protein